jgi:hypothetical protein
MRSITISDCAKMTPPTTMDSNPVNDLWASSVWASALLAGYVAPEPGSTFPRRCGPSS